MDGPVPHDPTVDRAAIEAAARDMGIVPGDPAYPFVQFMLRSAEAHAAEHRDHAARLARLLDRAGELAGGQIAKTAAGQLPGAVQQLTVRTFWRTALLAGGAGIALLAIGVAGGYWLGSSMEADKYVRTPAALGVALTGPDAAQWINLMRLNDIGRANRTCVDQAGGVACAFSLWTKPAPAKGAGG